MRARWLEDAFRLRHRYAHGRVAAPRRTGPAVWTHAEHQLLAAWLIPLLVKAALDKAGHYAWTAADTRRDAAFDSLALLDPFAPAPPDDEEPDEVESDEAALDDALAPEAAQEEVHSSSRRPGETAWECMVRHVELRIAGDEIARLLDADAVETDPGDTEPS